MKRCTYDITSSQCDVETVFVKKSFGTRSSNGVRSVRVVESLGSPAGLEPALPADLLLRGPF